MTRAGLPLLTWSNCRTCPNSCAASDWMSNLPCRGVSDHGSALLKRTSDSTGLPLLSYQLYAHASAPLQSWLLLRLPQSTVFVPSCASPREVVPLYWDQPFARSGTPHQLMLFTHSDWALRSAWTALPPAMLFGALPTRQSIDLRQ